MMHVHKCELSIISTGTAVGNKHYTFVLFFRRTEIDIQTKNPSAIVACKNLFCSQWKVSFMELILAVCQFYHICIQYSATSLRRASVYTGSSLAHMYAPFVSQKDPLESGLRFLPVFYAATILINLFSVFYDGPASESFWPCVLLSTCVLLVHSMDP